MSASAAASAEADAGALDAENSLVEDGLDASLLDADATPERHGRDDAADPAARAPPGEDDAVLDSPGGPRPGAGTQTDADAAPAEPEDEEEFPPDNTPDVRLTLVIMPENFRHETAVKALATGAEIKQKVVAELPLPPDVISLRIRGEPLPDDVALSDVGVHPGEDVGLELVVSYVPPPRADEGEDASPRGPLPDRVRVSVPSTEPGDEPLVVTVAIDASESTKPRYRGGYRNKRTGTTYHHAAMQTVPTKPKAWKTKFATETQTMEGRTRVAQTSREAATQMKRRDILLEDSRDVVVYAGKYMTADEVWAIKAEKAVVIQRYARGMRARRRRDAKRVERDARLARERAAEEEAIRREEAKRLHEISRREHPRTPADFAILREELRVWTMEAKADLDAKFPPPAERGAATSAARRDATKKLLAEETKLLRTMSRLRKVADAENEEVRVRDAMTDMAAEKRWERTDGSVVVVHTPFTIRAGELANLRDGLAMSNLEPEHRLEVLTHVKWTVKEFDCNLTREICELCDREADLTKRGRDPSALAGLRRRISSLFLQFCETPEFNPESARYSVAAQHAEEAEREATEKAAMRSSVREAMRASTLVRAS
jgi:hypothetical protein